MDHMRYLRDIYRHFWEEEMPKNRVKKMMGWIECMMWRSKELVRKALR